MILLIVSERRYNKLIDWKLFLFCPSIQHIMYNSDKSTPKTKLYIYYIILVVYW